MQRRRDRQVRSAVGIAGVVMLACTTLGRAAGPLTDGGELGTVWLARDAYGVAHVFADSDAGAYYGAGWAAAEDRLFQMSWHRLIVQGRTAEFFGAGPNDEHLEHDREMRLVGWARHADAALAALDDETRGLLEAYADGVDGYAQQPGVELHPLFAQYGIPNTPWTAADCIAVWIRMGRHFAPGAFGKAQGLHDFEALVRDVGLEAAIAEMTPQPVLDESAAAVLQSDVPAGVQQAIFDYADALGYGESTAIRNFGHTTPKFSHAWAVGGGLSTTGTAVVNSDPQTTIRVPSVWYEWHMRGRTFDVRGVGIPGSPNLLVGSSPDVAWGVTALGMDQSDLFRLAVDRVDHPGQYQLDGRWRDWDVEEPEVVAVADGASETVTYRETHWGPVVTAVVPDALPGEEYALKAIPLADSAPDSAAGFLAMYRARDARRFGEALAGWRFPTVNAIFGDRAGSIGYWSVGAAPLRSLASPLLGIIAQDGSSTEFDWIDLVPHELRPWVLDPAAGFVLSGNHMPVGAWYPLPLGFGTGSTGDTPRSRRLRERLQALPTFTPADVEAIHHDTVNVSRRDLVRLGLFLRDTQGHPLSADAVAALAELDGWLQAGAEMTGDHPATTAAHFIDVKFRENTAGELVTVYGGGQNGLELFLKTRIADIESEPPVPLPDDEAAFVDERLAAAWADAVAAAGETREWSAWFEAQQLHDSLAVWTSLEGFPSLDPATRIDVGPLTCTDGGTILSQGGQSYSQHVVTGAVDGAQSVLPLGVAEQGAHQLDQQALYETEALKPSPTSRDGILALGATVERIHP